MATEDQHYITRFTYSFTKDNLARCTKSTLARNETYNNEKICVHLCKSPILDLIFRFFQPLCFVYSESYQENACSVSCSTQCFMKEIGRLNTHAYATKHIHTPLHNKNVTCESFPSLHLASC